MKMKIKILIFKIIQLIHKTFFQKQLPAKIAIYFHNVKSVDIPKFEELLGYFEKNFYAFCDPSEYIKREGKCVFLSFDDNHSEWLGIAELLSRKNIKATFYINTGPVKDISSPDALMKYYRRKKYSDIGDFLSSNEIKMIYHEYGQNIGCHTVNHFDLTKLDSSNAEVEILQNKLDIEQIIGVSVKHFSYPFGMRRHFSDSLRDYCIKIGFETISNAIPGLLHKEIEKYDISRTMWDFSKSLNHNLTNLKIDGRLFENITGRSSISYH